MVLPHGLLFHALPTVQIVLPVFALTLASLLLLLACSYGCSS